MDILNNSIPENPMNYQTFLFLIFSLIFYSFVEEDPLKSEQKYDFKESKVLFIDKFQNETKMLDAEFYEISNFRLIIFILINICFIGIPLLFSKWSLSFKIKCIYRKCSFSQAKYIKIIDLGK